MPRPRKSALFELGGQWIAHDPPSPFLYRFWYDPGTGRTRRASLGTEDLGEAKLKLAQIVMEGAPKSKNSPIAIVLENYFKERTDRLPSGKSARNAGKLFLECWGKTARVSAIDEHRQKQFVEWSIKRSHSTSYIARNLGVLAAALAHAKLNIEVTYGENAICSKWVPDAKPNRRRFVPSDEELARFLDYDLPENLWRWVLVQLTTAGRPQTAIDLSPEMRNSQTGVIDLNPPGRKQNKKYRATVREPKVLSGWLDRWEREAREEQGDGTLPDNWRYCGYRSLESAQVAIERIRVEPEVSLPRLSAYSFRYTVTTVLRRSKRMHGVTEDDIAQQFGHRRPQMRTTAGYGEWEPDYLLNAADAIDTWLLRLQRLVKNRSLFSRDYPGLAFQRSSETSQVIENNGGRDRDRTCDPYHVNVRRSRRKPMVSANLARLPVRTTGEQG